MSAEDRQSHTATFNHLLDKSHTDCIPHADLIFALNDDILDHAIDADYGQHRRKHAKETRQRGHQALAQKTFANFIQKARTALMLDHPFFGSLSFD